MSLRTMLALALVSLALAPSITFGDTVSSTI